MLITLVAALYQGASPALTLPTSLPQCVEITPDGKHVVTGSRDGTLTLYRLVLPTFSNPAPNEQWAKVGSVNALDRAPIQMSVSADGTTIAAVGWSRSMTPRAIGKAWRPQDGKVVDLSLPENTVPHSFAVGKSGQSVYCFDSVKDGPNRFIELSAITGKATSVTMPAKSPDGQTEYVVEDCARCWRGGRPDSSGRKLAFRSRATRGGARLLSIIDLASMQWSDVPVARGHGHVFGWVPDSADLLLGGVAKVVRLRNGSETTILNMPWPDTLIDPIFALKGNRYVIGGIQEMNMTSGSLAGGGYSGTYRWYGLRVMDLNSGQVVAEVKDPLFRQQFRSSLGGVVVTWDGQKDGVAVYDFRDLVPDMRLEFDSGEPRAPIRVGDEVTMSCRVVNQKGAPIANAAIGVEDGVSRMSTLVNSSVEGKFTFNATAAHPGVAQVTFVLPDGGRSSFWVNVLDREAFCPTIGLRRFSIKNGSTVSHSVEVKVGRFTKTSRLNPGEQVEVASVTSISDPFPLSVTPYVGLTTAQFQAGPAKVAIDVTKGADGVATTTLTAGALLLRGKVYVDSEGNFGGCWAPGLDMGAGVGTGVGVFAEGFICVGNDLSVSVGVGAGVNVGPPTAGIEVRVKVIGEEPKRAR